MFVKITLKNVKKRFFGMYENIYTVYTEFSPGEGSFPRGSQWDTAAAAAAAARVIDSLRSNSVRITIQWSRRRG